MASAFQSNAFQNNAFQITSATQEITDTDILQLPVNVVLAGAVPIKDRYREFDIRPLNFRQGKTHMSARGGVRRIGGDGPSFTITTSRKGHD
jgi:hypothetical protein